MGESVALGIGIGLGVGLPVVLTVLVISYVTVQHHYRMRAEDRRDAEIDVNVDDSQYITPYKSAVDTTSSASDSYEKVYEPSKEYVQFHSGPVTGPAGLGLLNCDAPIPRGAYTPRNGSIVESHKTHSGRLGPAADLTGSLVYTPTFDVANVSQADLSRSLNSLYASPAYASTEKLRAPSFCDNFSERSGSVSSFSLGSANVNPPCGPFATPPRARAYPDTFHFDDTPSSGTAATIPLERI